MRSSLQFKSSAGDVFRLTPLRDNDAQRIQEACSEAETVRWLGNGVIAPDYDLENARSFIDFMRERVADGVVMNWAIVEERSDELVGNISLTGKAGSVTDTADLGYWTHPAARGRGVASAAARSVVNECFRAHEDDGSGPRRLTARVAVDNIASQRVIEQAGFTRIGRARQSDRLFDGAVTDEFTYDLLSTDPR